MSQVVEYKKPIGPTFYAELKAAGLEATLLTVRADGVISYADTVSAATIALVATVVAAHAANASSVVNSYVVAQGYDPLVQSVPYVPGVVGATAPALGQEFLEAAVTLTGGLGGSWRVREHLEQLFRGWSYAIAGTAVTSGGAIASGATVYGNPNFDSFIGTEPEAQLVLPGATRMEKLSVVLSTAQPGTGSLVVTVRSVGLANLSSLTIAAGSAAGTYSKTSLALQQTGGAIALRYVNNAATASGTVVSHAMLLGASIHLTPFASLVLALDRSVFSTATRVYIATMWAHCKLDDDYGTGGFSSMHLTAGDFTTLEALAVSYGITLA